MELLIVINYTIDGYSVKRLIVMKLTVDCFDLMVKMMTMNMMMMTMMTVGLEEGWIKNFLVRKVCWVLDKQYKYCG